MEDRQKEQRGRRSECDSNENRDDNGENNRQGLNEYDQPDQE